MVQQLWKVEAHNCGAVDTVANTLSSAPLRPREAQLGLFCLPTRTWKRQTYANVLFLIVFRLRDTS